MDEQRECACGNPEDFRLTLSNAADKAIAEASFCWACADSPEVRDMLRSLGMLPSRPLSDFVELS